MTQPKKVPKWIGNTPFPPQEKRPVRISRREAYTFLYGFHGQQVANDIYVSTDKVLLADWFLKPGCHYEPAGLHLQGDECYYILSGEAMAHNAETGETHELHPGDALLIPQGTRHQIFNFGAEPVHAIACIAPIAWADDGMGTFVPSVEGSKFLKGEE